jgi:hypothetical protein
MRHEEGILISCMMILSDAKIQCGVNKKLNEEATMLFYCISMHYGKLLLQIIPAFICGAADRDRTGTTVARREILSLLRLPIPPQRHI